MTVEIKGHAKEVVERFKIMVDDAIIAQIDQEHFDELETLIEAALGVVYSHAQHDFAKELEAVAHRLRKGSSKLNNQN